MRLPAADDWIVLAVFAFWFAAIGGWIANIVKIAWSISDPLTPMFLLRCIGAVLMPIGCILGYL